MPLPTKGDQSTSVVSNENGAGRVRGRKTKEITKKDFYGNEGLKKPKSGSNIEDERTGGGNGEMLAAEVRRKSCG